MVEPLLEARGLGVRLGMRRRLLRKDDKGYPILSNINFTMQPGEILALVGESGSGKTTLGRAIAGLTQIQAGSLLFQGKPIVDPDNVATIRTKDRAWYPRWRAYRKDIQMIFQDPLSSLNPRMTVGENIAIQLYYHGIGNRLERIQQASELLEVVGLRAADYDRYPHEFSGGQCQRVAIARALLLRPKLIIFDEPVSALDVSIRAQILQLLLELQTDYKLTYIFISHNLAVVDYMADRIAVMCAGRLVEQARREELFSNPVHPYTRALLAAVPEPDPQRQLDLSLLMEGRASVPSEWPEPFTETGGLATVRVGDNHWVRATAVPGDVPS